MSEKWPSKCFEKAQSPLNIVRQLTDYDQTLSDRPLILSGFDLVTVNPIDVQNNGHSGLLLKLVTTCNLYLIVNYN